MSIEGVPWMVDGARHPASLGRTLAYEAVKGGNGVGGGPDLKVSTTPTASGSVRIVPGNGFAVSRYAGVLREAYEIRSTSFTDVAIPATGSAAGATRYLVLRIDDPQFPGATAPASVTDGPYVRPYLETVDPGLNGQNLPYPNVPLAKIVQPVNTSTITAAMITDLRKIANPKQHGDKLVYYPTGTRTGGHPVPTAGYLTWPITDTQRPTLQVPEWATDIVVTGHFSGLYFTDTATGKPDTVAGIRTGLGASRSQNGIIIENDPGSRGHYILIGSHTIPVEMRGTAQQLNIQATRTAGTGMWYADYQSTLLVEYLFTERAV